MHRIAIPTLLLFLGGCAGGMAPTPLEVRVQNAGTVDFDNVVIGFQAESEEYGRLPAGAVSEYREVARAYRYAAFDVEAAGESYSMTPIDYVGETALEPGRYTFVLEVDVESRNLTFEMRRDE